MDKCMNSLGKATVLSRLDAISEYWQIEVDDTDQDKPSFTSYDGYY